MKITLACFTIFLFSIGSLFANNDHVIVFLYTNNIDHELSAEQVFKNHQEYLEKLKSDHLITYGIFSNGNEVLLFETSDINKVKELVELDPAVKKEFYSTEYFRFSMRTGKFCVSESIDVKEYKFVRYSTHITKYNVQQVPYLLNAHDDYVKQVTKTGNVLAGGYFENSDGGFIILRGDLDSDVITSDPTYAAGFIIPEINNIYMHKGSICK